MGMYYTQHFFKLMMNNCCRHQGQAVERKSEKIYKQSTERMDTDARGVLWKDRRWIRLHNRMTHPSGNANDWWFLSSMHFARAIYSPAAVDFLQTVQQTVLQNYKQITMLLLWSGETVSMELWLLTPIGQPPNDTWLNMEQQQNDSRSPKNSEKNLS
jgi:hypothetical protein